MSSTVSAHNATRDARAGGAVSAATRDRESDADGDYSLVRCTPNPISTPAKRRRCNKQDAALRLSAGPGHVSCSHRRVNATEASSDCPPCEMRAAIGN